MARMEIKILRDVAKNPSVIEVLNNGRKMRVKYDGDSLIFEGDQSQFPTTAEALQMAYPYELESQSRPAYYDRNPKSVVYFSHQISMQPAADIEYTIYKVPEGRRALIENFAMEILLVTASASATDCFIHGILSLNGATRVAGTRIIDAGLTGNDNTVGDNDKDKLENLMFLNNGDVLYSWQRYPTGFGADGGECETSTYVKMTEFDE